MWVGGGCAPCGSGNWSPGGGGGKKAAVILPEWLAWGFLGAKSSSLVT